MLLRVKHRLRFNREIVKGKDLIFLGGHVVVARGETFRFDFFSSESCVDEDNPACLETECKELDTETFPESEVLTKEVFKELYLTMRSKQFYLNHYPSNHKDGCINLFGHTHRITGLWKPFGLNVSCDLNHFFLFSEDEIFRLLEQKSSFWDHDIDVLCR